MRTKDLTPNPKNPRKITDEKLEMLKRAMLEFGDLSGIVYNRKSKQLVGGRQRTKIDSNAVVTVTKPDHPTTKPVDLIEYCIGNNTKPGEIVFDGFGGSGSTLIACEKLGRQARLVELDPSYCDVIVERWEKYTGQKARLLNPPKLATVTKLRKKPEKQDRKQESARV